MNSFFLRALALTVLLLCGGCATTQFSGYVSANAHDRQIVENGGYSPRATAQIVIVQNPDINGGVIDPRALKKIQEYSISCQRQVDRRIAGAGQSAVSGAVPYGGAGAVGVGLGAKAAFVGASLANYAKYGGIASLFSGGVNGLVSGSYAMASAKGECTKEFWRDVSQNDPAFRGTHVLTAYAGKAWGASAPPALDNSTISSPAH